MSTSIKRKFTYSYFLAIFEYGFISYQIISNHVKSYQIMSNHVKSYQIISSHIKSYQIMSNHVKSCQIMSNHIKSISRSFYLLSFSCNRDLASLIFRRILPQEYPFNESSSSSVPCEDISFDSI